MRGTTPGRRLDDGKFSDERGVYGRDERGWWVIPPAEGIGMGYISKHDVTEHEDGTITVSPSILIQAGRGRSWHGYLERGVWREC